MKGLKNSSSSSVYAFVWFFPDSIRGHPRKFAAEIFLPRICADFFVVF